MPTKRYANWESFPVPEAPPGSVQGDLPVAFSADLSAASVLAACRRGIVPLPAAGETFRTFNEFRYRDHVEAGAIAVVGSDQEDPYWAAWWSPDPRLVLGAADVHLGRNTRKRLRRDELTTTADTAFRRVAEACRAGREPRWLTDTLLSSLTELHSAGWAHSTEVWLGGELVGGAMGIGIGTVLSGDTLFGRHPGAAAVAVADMGARLAAAGGTVIDAQWDSPFLRALGAVPVARPRFRALLSLDAGPLALPRRELPARRLLPAPS